MTRVRAGAAALLGGAAESVEALGRALQIFRALGMQAYARCAELRLLQQQRAPVDLPLGALRELGCADPWSWASLYAPGFEASAQNAR